MQSYVPLKAAGCRAVALDWAAPAVYAALSSCTLHEWASKQAVSEKMLGRGVIYSVELPTSPPIQVVIRRNRHGGILRNLTGELFLKPTRAPYELATSVRLADAGVLTPEVIAYAVYPVAGIFARSDVMTRRLPQGNDLPEAWRLADNLDHDSILTSVADLLAVLARAGAWHADLNLKNIYISGTGVNISAYLLDIDRVTFPGGNNIAELNFERLARSARKWRTRWGLDIDEKAIERLAPGR